MIFIQFDKTATEHTHVMLIHYQPDILPQEMLDAGLLIENLPEPEQIPQKSAILMINPATEVLFYNYVDRPLTDQEKIKALEEENANLWYQTMTTQGELDNAKSEIASIWYEIMLVGGV